ncbi:MAG: molybdate ABC transporter substrate-binding protein [Chthoniobacterales bacterium]|nr:molybdate ABC transporter substrate-binding protein [Chthoniobacterales bacterium]
MKTKIVTLLLGAACLSDVSAAAELTVHAAASLTEALKEIGAAYERASGDKIVFDFGASSLLERQIEQGAPGDIFVSADEAKMDLLEKQGAILAGTRRAVLSNTLVVVVAADASVALTKAADLAEPQIKRFALAETQTVPAGIYAREYLEKLGPWEKIQGKVVPTDNVRGTLAAVESGNVDAGIVYKTDALISRRVKIATEIPAAEGPKISYPVAVLKSSRDPERAKKFAQYLAGPVAAETFKKFGFMLAQ